MKRAQPYVVDNKNLLAENPTLCCWSPLATGNQSSLQGFMKIVTPEFQKTIQELIDNLRPEQFSDAEEYKLARKYNALPVGVDLWSYVFLTASGEVIWDDGEGETGSTNDLQSLIRILAVRKERYPQFGRLIPDPWEESKTCPVCSGSGVWGQSKEVSTEKPGRCFICAGLGWVTDETYSEILKNSK